MLCVAARFERKCPDSNLKFGPRALYILQAPRKCCGKKCSN